MKELINEIEGDFYQLSLAQEQLKFLENFAITQTIASNKESIRVALEHHNAFFGIKRTVSLEDTETSLRLAIEESKGLISRFIDKIKEKIHKLMMFLSTKNGKVLERVKYLKNKMKEAEFAKKEITKTTIVENFADGEKSALTFTESAQEHSEDYLFILKTYYERLTNGKELIVYDTNNKPIEFRNTSFYYSNGTKELAGVFKNELAGLDSGEYTIHVSQPLLKYQQIAFLFVPPSSAYVKYSPVKETNKSSISPLSESACKTILDKAEHAQKTLKASLGLDMYYLSNDMKRAMSEKQAEMSARTWYMVMKSEELILDTLLASLDYVEESM